MLAVKRGFSALTHGSCHRHVDLWRDSPLLNPWLSLPESLSITAAQFTRLNKDIRKGNSASCTPASSLWGDFSLFTMRLRRTECTSLQWLLGLPRCAGKKRKQLSQTFLTQIFEADCGRDGVQSLLLVCFSKVCIHRCVKTASGFLCFTLSHGLANSGTQRSRRIATTCYF